MKFFFYINPHAKEVVLTPNEIAQEVYNYYFQIYGFYPVDEVSVYINSEPAIIEMKSLVQENLNIVVIPDPAETFVDYVTRVQEACKNVE